LPTSTEWEDERQSWTSNNAAGAFASPLKLPAGGSHNYRNGGIYDVSWDGNYWSSTVDGGSSLFLHFYNRDVIIDSYYRTFGLSVRCIKD
jgi:hypothetical protein